MKRDHWSYWLAVAICADTGCIRCYVSMAWRLTLWAVTLDEHFTNEATPDEALVDMLEPIMRDGMVESGNLYEAAQRYRSKRVERMN